MNSRPHFFAAESSVKSSPSIQVPRIGTKGDTLLHLASHYNSADRLHRILSCLDKGLAEKMARTVNHQGFLPLQLVKKNPGSAQEKASLTNLLLYLTLEKKSEAKTYFASLTQLAKDYPYPWSEALRHNFRLACLVLNETKKVIHDSNTYPRVNNYDADKSFRLNSMITELRKELISEKQRIKKIYLPKNEWSEEKKQLIFDRQVSLIKMSQVGNCSEQSYFGLNYSMKVDRETYAEVFTITNGGHVFLVLGRDPKSLENDYTNWGPAAVVCDIWAGKIFPAAMIPEHLPVYLAFPYLGRWFNLSGDFNPKFHKLAVSTAFNKDDKLTSQLFNRK